MVEPLQAAVPQVDVKWYQSGSENVEGRLTSEMELGKIRGRSRCDERSTVVLGNEAKGEASGL